MCSNHLKRLSAPKTWQIKRKGIKFITKPSPGTHRLESSISLNTLMKEVLGYATTTREVKKIINTCGVKIDGRARKDRRFPVGIFDTIEFPSTDEYFRAFLNKKGKIDIVKIGKEDSMIKPCKIIGKRMVDGRMQINLFDGKNIFTNDKSFKVGDSVLISLKDWKIMGHLKLAKKSTIFLTSGKHIGDLGNVEDVINNRIIYKNKDNEIVETLKEYAFVIGEGKPSISLQ